METMQMTDRKLFAVAIADLAAIKSRITFTVANSQMRAVEKVLGLEESTHGTFVEFQKSCRDRGYLVAAAEVV